MISSFTRRVLLAVVIGSAALLSLTPLASAQSRTSSDLELTVVPNAAIGDTIEIEAVLTSGGAALADTEIIFLRAGKFFNTGSDIEIGTATTNAAGVASVSYSPRTEGEILLMAEFEGSSDVRAAFTETTIVVATGPALYSQEAGISVPFVNVSWLFLILGAVWVTFLFVMYLIWRIASEGSFTSTSGVHGE